jgi:hypothetical protein
VVERKQTHLLLIRLIQAPVFAVAQNVGGRRALGSGHREGGIYGQGSLARPKNPYFGDDVVWSLPVANIGTRQRTP